MMVLDGLPAEIASYAHETLFEHRRGMGQLTDSRAEIGIYVFDKNPYGVHPAEREREHADLIALLMRRGCRLAARAAYPADGDSAGYTVAMVFVSASSEAALADESAAYDHYERLLQRKPWLGLPSTTPIN